MKITLEPENLKIMKVEACGAVLALAPDTKHSSYQSTYGKRTDRQLAEVAKQKLEAAYAEDIATHEANKEALEINNEIYHALRKLMENLGFPASFSAPKPGSRSWPPKRKTFEAGYLSDLKRSVRITDGFDMAQQRYNDLNSRFTAALGAAVSDEERRKLSSDREKEQERQRRINDIGLAKLIVKYGWPDDISFREALAKICEMNKYIDLAYAMERVRNDWNDGCDPVIDALHRFRIENDTDKEIVVNVSGLTADWSNQMDGRIFRDANWNYSRIRALAETVLAEEASFLSSSIME